MLDLRELYQEIILDHNRNPRNQRVIAHATCHAEGVNPLCGDKLTLYIKLDNQERIADISFIGQGCAISQASASLMTEALMGKTIHEAEEIFNHFHDMVTTEEPIATLQLDKLAVLAGVRAYPARVKCATLAWHTLMCALRQEGERVTTE